MSDTTKTVFQFNVWFYYLHTKSSAHSTTTISIPATDTTTGTTV